MSKKILLFFKKYLLITLGAMIYAAGISLFLDPNNIAPGGVTGLSIIINKFVQNIPTGTWIIIMNIPILIIGIWKFGFRFFISTIYAVLCISGFTNFFSGHFGSLTNDLFLACGVGGALASFGIGIVFRQGATTGGSDILIKILRLKIRHINTGAAFFFVDMLVVLLSGVVFKNINLALYAAFTVLVQSAVLNFVLYGGDEARLVYIISKQKDEIAYRLMNEVDAGATFLEARGAYTGNKKDVLLCVLHMRALPRAKDIVKTEDKDAFMIVTSASSVFGEGFKSHNEEEL